MKFSFSTLLIISALIFSTQAFSAEKRLTVLASKNVTGKFVAQKPIDINIDVNGVKLDSIYFDTKKLQAFIILRNRTPSTVTPKVGLAIFGDKNKLIASGEDAKGFSFSSDNIGAGEQKNINLAIGSFLNDFKKAKRFQIVFSIIDQPKEVEESVSNQDDE